MNDETEVVDPGVTGETHRMGACSEIVGAGGAGETDRMGRGRREVVTKFCTDCALKAHARSCSGAMDVSHERVVEELVEVEQRGFSCRGADAVCPYGSKEA